MSELVIGGTIIPPGKTAQLEIQVVSLYTNIKVFMPVHVMRGKEPGPTIFVSAAVHGDELNGIEIIRRLVNKKNLRLTCGTLILVPMVNIYGVLNQSRYMPDRRDLNRSFPGSPNGSLAGIVADKFLTEIVSHCQYGIDLHTGAIHRSNLPQIRADLHDTETRFLAGSFGVPVLLNSDLRDGSLRQAAIEQGVKVLVYEAGEALRFDELSIRAGVNGVLNVLKTLKMIRASEKKSQKSTCITPFVANKSHWERAPCSGITTVHKKLGDLVQTGDRLATIGSPLGSTLDRLNASRTGIIIGKQNIPLVQQGEALFHVAYFSEEEEDVVVENIEYLQDALMTNDPYHDYS